MSDSNCMTTTAKIRAWTANGGKKTLGKVGAAGGVSALTVIATIQFLYADDIARVKQTVIDSAVTQEAVKNLSKSVDEMKSDLERKIDKLLDLQIQSMKADDVKPQIQKDVVVQYFRVAKDDRTSKSFWRHGAAADTLMIPKPDSL